MKKNSHAQFICDLVNSRGRAYEFVATNVEYSNPKTGECGELDVLAKRGSLIDVYEVKCNDQFTKAIVQLERAYRALYAPGIDLHTWYYSGRHKKLVDITGHILAGGGEIDE